MKEAVIDRRTLEIIFRDQKAEIDNWSDRHLWYATATGCYNVYRCRTTFRLKKTLKREVNGLLLANRQTGCENLLLLTDHEFKDVEKDGHRISVRPVYEWSVTDY